MTAREELLARIDAILAEVDAGKVYGDFWNVRDYKTRRSYAAGDYALAVGTLSRLEAKLKRHPRGIGGRKTRARIRATQRQLRRLVVIISEPLDDYHPGKPQYIDDFRDVIPPSDPIRKEGKRTKDSATASAFVIT